MRYSVLSVIISGFSALTQAAITFPTKGTSWPVGQEKAIKWDMAGATGPLDMYIAPAESSDTSSANRIASGVPNTGSYSWTPSSFVAAKKTKIIVVDAMKTNTYSENFLFINKGAGKGHVSNKTMAKGNEMLTTHSVVLTSTGYDTAIPTEMMLTMTSVKTLQTTAPMFANTSVTSPPAVSNSINDGVVASSDLVATTPLGTAPTAGNGTFVSPTATAGPSQAQFNGAMAPNALQNSNLMVVGVLCLVAIGFI